MAATATTAETAAEAPTAAAAVKPSPWNIRENPVEYRETPWNIYFQLHALIVRTFGRSIHFRT